MKKTLLFLIATSSCASLMGMQMESDATPIDSKAIAIPIQLDDIELYSARPFSELIEEDHAADKPYLFARIDTEDTPDKKERRQYSHYVDAAQLNKQLVQNTHPYFQPSESVKHPTNRLLIKNIAYFMITKESKETCTQVGTYDEFSNPEQRWNKLFRHNQLPTANTTQATGLAQLQAIARTMQENTPGYQDTNRLDGITAAPSRNVQETTPLMRNQASRNYLKDCLACVDHCCNQPLHGGCTSLGTCIGASMIGVLHTATLVTSCLIDTACLPVACVLRPCKNPETRSRNDAFCYFTRDFMAKMLHIKTCYGINITTSETSCCDAYCPLS